jgi:catechol 2,3-dioxygenase-like lactoylglutathione lyase family enzyme
MVHDSWSSFSVKDIEESRKFYDQVLGIRVNSLEMGILELHPPGDTKLWLYPKKDHEPATFTVLNLLVDNIDKEVDRFIGLGIRFERYEGFNTDEKGIVRSENGPLIAWFKDPSGNVIALIDSAPTA